MSRISLKPITAENRHESNNRRHRPVAFVLALSIAVPLLLGGCSWTFFPESAANDSGAALAEADIQTGSITPSDPMPQLKNLSEEDLRRAKAALAVALDPHGSTDRVLWDNPQTTAKGNFVSDGVPFVKNDEICRNFKAMVATQDDTRNLVGTACRPSGGEWDITDLRNTSAKAKVTDVKGSDKKTSEIVAAQKPPAAKPAAKSAPEQVAKAKP